MNWKTWKTLNDYFQDWETEGIFSILHKNNPETPWDDTAAKNLDIYYHGLRSGNKIAADGLELLASSPVLNFGDAVSGLILAKFLKNWQKLAATENLEYNPIENYRMTETGKDTHEATRTPDLTRNVTRTPDLTHETTRTETPGEMITTTRTPDLTETETETRTPDLTETDNTTRTPDLTDTETVTNRTTDTSNNVFGFDSSASVPTDEGKSVENGETKRENTGSETTESQKTTTGTEKNEVERSHTGSETVEENHSGANGLNETITDTGSEDTTETTTGTEKNDEETNHTLTRSGNIGVTTSQQMIQSERDLWNWNLIEAICIDLDSVLTCNIW